VFGGVALGTLLTELRVDRARTVMHRSDLIDLDLLNRQLHELSEETIVELQRDGLEGEATVNAYLNMRYLGQNFGEVVPLDTLNLDNRLRRAAEGRPLRAGSMMGEAPLQSG